jgi:hypothetical protein
MPSHRSRIAGRARGVPSKLERRVAIAGSR